MLESLDVGTIITLVIAGVGTFAGGAWALVKGKLKKVINLGAEALDVAKSLEDALEDDKIDKKEIESIKKELTEVKDAWRVLVAKD